MCIVNSPPKLVFRVLVHYIKLMMIIMYNNAKIVGPDNAKCLVLNISSQ